MNNTIPNLKRYYSPILNVLEFKTLDERTFLVFGVPKAKYLAHLMLVLLERQPLIHMS